MALEKGYIQHAEELLEEAKNNKKGKRAPDYTDDKFLVPDKKSIESLIGAGGQIACLNKEATDGNHINEVVYKEHLFIFPVKGPQIFVIEGHKRY